MKESAERTLKVGFRRNPKKVFDDVERIKVAMIRNGWEFKETFLEEGLGKMHLFFEREVESS